MATPNFPVPAGYIAVPTLIDDKAAAEDPDVHHRILFKPSDGSLWSISAKDENENGIFESDEITSYQINIVVNSSTHILTTGELSQFTSPNALNKIFSIPMEFERTSFADFAELAIGESIPLNFRVNAYERFPATADYTLDPIRTEYLGETLKTFEVHRLKYDRSKDEDGPYGNGGWAGMYFRFIRDYGDSVTLDPNAQISFWIRAPDSDSVQFEIAASDKNWDQIGDSITASKPLNDYFVGPHSKMNATWGKIEIPLTEFKNIDLKAMVSFVLKATGGHGTIETTTPVLERP